MDELWFFFKFCLEHFAYLLSWQQPFQNWISWDLYPKSDILKSTHHFEMNTVDIFGLYFVNHMIDETTEVKRKNGVS